MKFSRIARRTLVVLSFGGMVTMFGGQSAEAATETDDFVVDVTVSTSCLIATLPVNFGTYNPLTTNNTAPLDNSAGEVRVTCANGLPVVIRLSEGSNPAGGSTPGAPLRQMAGPAPGDVLDYQLYSDAPGGAVWGDTALTGVATTGTGLPQPFTIHGRIPAGRNPAAGAYADLVTASVDF